MGDQEKAENTRIHSAQRVYRRTPVTCEQIQLMARVVCPSVESRENNEISEEKSFVLQPDVHVDAVCSVQDSIELAAIFF